MRRVDRQGGGLDLVQEMFGLCEAKNGTKIDELLQAGASYVQKSMARCSHDVRFSKMAGPAKEAKLEKLKDEKRRITRKEYQRLLNKFEMEGFIAQKRLRNLAKKKPKRCKTEVPCPGKKEMPSESTRQGMKKTSWAVG